MNERQKIFDHYPGTQEELVFLEGPEFDRAIIGVAYSFNGVFSVCYSEPEVLNVLMQHNGMTHDEAVEYFNFNISGAYVGPSTPVFVDVGVMSAD